VAWLQGDQACVRVEIVMDDARESDQLAEALDSWSSSRSGATVVGSGPFLVTACG
jgi:hypothetical protein